MASKRYRIELGLIENWPDACTDVIFWRVIRNARKLRTGVKIVGNAWDLWQGQALIHGKLITVHGWCYAGGYPVDWHDYVE